MMKLNGFYNYIKDADTSKWGKIRKELRAAKAVHCERCKFF